jgi:hypothetical protein
MDWREAIKYAIIGIALAVVAFMFFGGGSGSTVPQAYFYDLSEEKLYSVPRDTFPPHRGIGGESGDGVEAIVFSCPQQLCTDPDEPRIAYLKSHTPEYKQKREEAEAKGEDIPGLTRDYISDNTLIRLPEGEQWHKASSSEGGDIVSGWKVRCSHGKWVEAVFPN